MFYISKKILNFQNISKFLKFFQIFKYFPNFQIFPNFQLNQIHFQISKYFSNFQIFSKFIIFPKFPNFFPDFHIFPNLQFSKLPFFSQISKFFQISNFSLPNLKKFPNFEFKLSISISVSVCKSQLLKYKRLGFVDAQVLCIFNFLKITKIVHEARLWATERPVYGLQAQRQA